MLSSSFLDNLRKEFGDSMKIIRQDEDEGWVNADDLDWYKEEIAKETPGSNLRFYRNLADMTQKELADKLGMTKQHISDMERDKRAISKATAKKLGSLFKVSPVRFI